jgi:hypothetical protein
MASYSLLCQKLPECSACIECCCCLHWNVQMRAEISCNLFDLNLLWTAITVLYRPFRVALLLLALLSSLHTSGAVGWWCCEGCDCWELLHQLSMLICFVKHSCVRSVVMELLLLCTWWRQSNVRSKNSPIGQSIKHSTSCNDRQSLIELGVICAIVGEWRKGTHQDVV